MKRINIKYLTILTLFLVACQDQDIDAINAKKDLECKNKDSGLMYAWQVGHCIRAKRPEPKYKVPNEFTMKDGCKIRSTTYFYQEGNNEMFKEEGYFYPSSEGLNNWTKKCSQPKTLYLESEIVKARYK